MSNGPINLRALFSLSCLLFIVVDARCADTLYKQSERKMVVSCDSARPNLTKIFGSSVEKIDSVDWQDTRTVFWRGYRASLANGKKAFVYNCPKNPAQYRSYMMSYDLAKKGVEIPLRISNPREVFSCMEELYHKDNRSVILKDLLSWQQKSMVPRTPRIPQEAVEGLCSTVTVLRGPIRLYQERGCLGYVAPLADGSIIAAMLENGVCSAYLLRKTSEKVIRREPSIFPVSWYYTLACHYTVQQLQKNREPGMALPR